ncbi:hypothetical protein pb186bvf_000810 [Paramecium bursaria]
MSKTPDYSKIFINIFLMSQRSLIQLLRLITFKDHQGTYRVFVKHMIYLLMKSPIIIIRSWNFLNITAYNLNHQKVRRGCCSNTQERNQPQRLETRKYIGLIGTRIKNQIAGK